MTPKTMKAVLLTGHGGLDKLVYREDVPVPRPAAGEVLIEVSACGMNNTDVWVREGAYGTDEDAGATASWRRAGENTLSFPRIQGADTVGRIAAVGAGVPEGRIGERIMVDFSLYNRDDDSLADIDYIGHGRDGGYAEYCAVPAENAHAVRTARSDAELATFCCAYLAGEHMLDRVRVAAAERVLITGASGGVGSGLVQLCRARGAIPYAIASRSKAEAVKAIGAEAVICRGEGDPVAAVEAATGGTPIDVVADLVAGPLFGDLLQILRPEDRYIRRRRHGRGHRPLRRADHVPEAPGAAWLVPGHPRLLPALGELYRGRQDQGPAGRPLSPVGVSQGAKRLYGQGLRRQAGGGAGRQVGRGECRIGRTVRQCPAAE